MEKIKRLLQEANQDFRTAEHLMYINNTMASDGKLLIYIAKKLHLTVSNCLDALLNY